MTTSEYFMHLWNIQLTCCAPCFTVNLQRQYLSLHSFVSPMPHSAHTSCSKLLLLFLLLREVALCVHICKCVCACVLCVLYMRVCSVYVWCVYVCVCVCGVYVVCVYVCVWCAYVCDICLCVVCVYVFL